MLKLSTHGRNEEYGIRDQRPEKDRDQESQLSDLESRRVGSGSAVFFMESGIKFLRFQGSKFSHFWDQGSKFWLKIWDQLRKNVPRFLTLLTMVGGAGG